jgi:tripeptide aminopeptidase
VTVSPDEVARCREEALEICQVPAPTFAEGDRAGLVRAKLEQAGLRTWKGESGSVYARIGPRGPAVVVAAHLDTVFSAETDITPRQEGQRIYGPGFADNSLGLAGLLALARRMAGQELDRGLLLVATTGEEGLGNLLGAREILKEHRVAEFVALEGIGLDPLVVSGPGSIRWRLEVSGPGGHSWSNRGQASAVEGLVSFLSQAKTLRTEELAVNIGRISGGSGASVIAGEAEALFELRSIDRDVLAQGESDFLSCLEDHREQSSLCWSISELGRRPGGRSPESGLIDSLIQIRAELGIEGPDRAFSTDANVAYSAGIPAVSIGLADGGDIHTVSEWGDLTRLGLGLELLFRLVEERTS